MNTREDCESTVKRKRKKNRFRYLHLSVPCRAAHAMKQLVTRSPYPSIPCFIRSPSVSLHCCLSFIQLPVSVHLHF